MAQIIKAGGSGGGKSKKRTTPWDTGAAPVQYKKRTTPWDTGAAPVQYSLGAMLDTLSPQERDAFNQWTGTVGQPAPKAPTDPYAGDGSDGSGSGFDPAPYDSLRSQIMSQYDTGKADLLRSALGGRNSIGDAGSSFQKAVASLGQDARREGDLAGRQMQDSLGELLRQHRVGMDRSVGDLARQGFDDPRLAARMAESDTSIRRQGVSNRGYQDRLMEIFGQDMNARQQGGRMITEGALSQLANVQHLREGELDAQKQKALSDLVASQAAARSRSGSGGSRGSGAAGSTGYIDEQGIFHQAVGYSKDAEYATGVDDDLRGSISPEAKRIYDRMSGQRKGKADAQLAMLQRRVDAGEDWHDLRRRFSSYGNDKELNAIVYDYFRPYDQAEKKRVRRKGLVSNPPVGSKG